MNVEDKFLSDLTEQQIRFRTKVINELLDMLREKFCCSRVVLEDGRDFRLMPYAKLLNHWKGYFPNKQIPEGCEP